MGQQLMEVENLFYSNLPRFCLKYPYNNDDGTEIEGSKEFFILILLDRFDGFNILNNFYRYR